MDIGGKVGLVGSARQGIAGAILPLAAVLVPLSILAVVGWLSWRSVWGDARSQMIRAAGSAAEYGARTLESYSLAADRVNDRLRGLSNAAIRDNEQALHLDLQRLDADLTQSERTYVVDRDGHVLLASRLYPVPRDASLKDRDYFQAFSGPKPPAVHIGQTFVDPFDGRVLFSVSRPRRDTGNPPDARGFEGIVMVAINPHGLADGLRRLLEAPDDRMALMRADGYGLTTTGSLLDLKEPLPRVKPESPFYSFVASGARSADYLSSTAMPGTTALLAMRKIEGFPVYAVALRGSGDIAARWWGIMATQLAFGIPATLGLLLLSLRVRRDQHRLAETNAGLRIDQELSTDRLIRAKRFGLVGTFEFDLRTGVSRRSPEYMSVHGLPAVATEESHADWASRLHPDDRERAEGHVLEALSDASGATEYAQTYRIITPAGEVRWIAARGEIVRDETGRIVMLLGAHVDVTPMRTTELALAESDARLRLTQEAVGIGTWEWARSTRTLRLSRQMLEILGFNPNEGQPTAGATLARLHPADRRRVGRELALARRSGQLRSEFRILRLQTNGGMQTIWLAARARLLSPNGGIGDRMMGVAYDVTERKFAEAQAALLAHEAEHRTKNALSVVAALVQMTVAKDHQEFVEVVQGRIMALARATTLLGQRRWQGANLQDLIRHELAPFQVAAENDATRIAQIGPPIMLTAEQVQPLCMALHELATNAAKYGALSVPEGRLELRWWQAESQVHLEWRERGGPRLEGPPSRRSFGSRLIQQIFSEQLHGTIVKCWDPEGLSCSVSFPLEEH